MVSDRRPSLRALTMDTKQAKWHSLNTVERLAFSKKLALWLVEAKDSEDVERRMAIYRDWNTAHSRLTGKDMMPLFVKQVDVARSTADEAADWAMSEGVEWYWSEVEYTANHQAQEQAIYDTLGIDANTRVFVPLWQLGGDRETGPRTGQSQDPYQDTAFVRAFLDRVMPLFRLRALNIRIIARTPSLSPVAGPSASIKFLVTPPPNNSNVQ